jgi:TonB family protein
MQRIRTGTIIGIVCLMSLICYCTGSNKQVDKTDTSDSKKISNEESQTKVITGAITPPKPIKSTMVPPKYPKSAKKSGVEGKVVINFIVTKDGIPESIYVDKGLREDCDKQCLKAIKKWRFIPATYEGKPVAVYFYWTFTFDLK